MLLLLLTFNNESIPIFIIMCLYFIQLFRPCMLIEMFYFYPEHLSQVRIAESEGNIGDMKAFGLGFPRPLLLAASSCSAPRPHGDAQRLRVRGHGGQTFVLIVRHRDRERGLDKDMWSGVKVH